MKDRIKKIIDNNNLSSAQFADKIGVTRSSLSHVLSGRNKPSLDYVLKIIKVFPHIDSKWLLTGEGYYDETERTHTDNDTNVGEDSLNKIQSSFSNLNKQIAKGKNKIMKDVLSDNENIIDKMEDETEVNKYYNSKTNNSSDIDKIVFFYKNGSFEVYFNK